MKEQISILAVIVGFAVSHLSFTKSAVVTGAVLIGIDCQAQFSPVFRQSDSAEVYPGSWTGIELYSVKDSVNAGSGNFIFSVPNVKFNRFKSTRNDGTPTSTLWVDNNGFLKRSSVTVGKRQETYTASTNASGIVTFTFSAYPATPNIQYVPGFGTTNKETIIHSAAPTTTSCSFYVQLRTDVVGLLPSYSNVNGREVNILVTEK